ncbi:hypothetical protein Agub_g8361, partial [Astrephomene gubernaculifera]
MVCGLRGSPLCQVRTLNAPAPVSAGGSARSVVVSAVKQRSGELRNESHRRGSRYEPCEPSTSSLADFGARVTLERLYTWNALDGIPSGAPQGAFLLSVNDRPQRARNQDRSEDYFANVGDAIRCLREDVPLLFQRELNYGIYRDDIVFRDPRNCFKGMKNYQLIFWSLRFHGKLFFRSLYVDVQRIWQPEDGVIKMRWTVHGIPRVPWEAEGTFDGISTYRLDSHGKIYEHCVDNVLLRDPPMATNPPLLAGLNLQPLVPSQQPVPGAWCQGAAEADAQWGSYVHRVVASALQGLEQEPEPTAAVAGMPLSRPHSHAAAGGAAHAASHTVHDGRAAARGQQLQSWSSSSGAGGRSSGGGNS